MKNFKERITELSGSLSGAVSFLGSYQVCHAVCLWLIALLSLIGITIVGMPLLFLQKVAVPFWILAALLLVVSFSIYIKKKCISKNILMLNSGIILASVPFSQLQDFSPYFMIIGGMLVVLSLIFMIKNKMLKIKKVKKWQKK